MQQKSNEVFVVMEGNKVSGIYYYRDDAQMHAQAMGGTVIVQQLRYTIPVWVKTMVDAAKEKAKLQNQSRR